MADNELKTDRCTYIVDLLSPDVAHDLWIELIRSLAPMAESASQCFSEAHFMSMLPKVASLIDTKTIARARDLFKKVTRVQLPEGATVNLTDIYAVHFRGHLVEMNQWLMHCLKVQYADFLRLLTNDTDQESQ